MAAEKINLPERQEAFCKAVASLCREYGMVKATIEYTHGAVNAALEYAPKSDEEIRMALDQGRHDHGNNALFITSTMRIWTKLTT